MEVNLQISGNCIVAQADGNIRMPLANVLYSIHRHANLPQVLRLVLDNGEYHNITVISAFSPSLQVAAPEAQYMGILELYDLNQLIFSTNNFVQGDIVLLHDSIRAFIGGVNFSLPDIPSDTTNSDSQGHDSAPPPPPLPSLVTLVTMKDALIHAGLNQAHLSSSESLNFSQSIIHYEAVLTTAKGIGFKGNLDGKETITYEGTEFTMTDLQEAIKGWGIIAISRKRLTIGWGRYFTELALEWLKDRIPVDATDILFEPYLTYLKIRSQFSQGEHPVLNHNIQLADDLSENLIWRHKTAILGVFGLKA
ncbi:hypothetical protein C8J56DRAFT_1052816 [Mycena floridula]|nr:hypothetical protein C8J56DRAFT_1052816 [Mycena floridula]